MKTLTKMLALGILFLGVFAGFVSAQSKIRGKAVDGDGQVLPLTRINLLSEGSLIAQTQSNMEGEYQFSNLSPATYDLEVLYQGKSFFTKGIVLAQSESRPLDLVAGVYESSGTTIVGVRGEPIFRVDPIDPKPITKEMREEMGIRNINDLASIYGGFQAREGGALQFRGGREGTTAYFIDGVKLVGVPGIPAPMYGQITPFHGGLPAEYGDVTGGVIVVNTYNRGMKGWFGEPRNKKHKANRPNTELNVNADILITSIPSETHLVIY